MEEAKLIWIEHAKDEDGFPVVIDHEDDIFVDEASVTRVEFYESMRAGISVKIVLVARIEDFLKSEHMAAEKKEYAREIIYDGSRYEIIRTYKKGKSKIELVCS